MLWQAYRSLFVILGSKVEFWPTSNFDLLHRCRAAFQVDLTPRAMGNFLLAKHGAKEELKYQPLFLVGFLEQTLEVVFSIGVNLRLGILGPILGWASRTLDAECTHECNCVGEVVVDRPIP